MEGEVGVLLPAPRGNLPGTRPGRGVRARDRVRHGDAPRALCGLRAGWAWTSPRGWWRSPRRSIPSLSFRVADAEAFDPGETFDFVIVPDVVEHLTDPRAMFRSARKACHSGIARDRHQRQSALGAGPPPRGTAGAEDAGGGAPVAARGGNPTTRGRCRVRSRGNLPGGSSARKRFQYSPHCSTGPQSDYRSCALHASCRCSS